MKDLEARIRSVAQAVRDAYADYYDEPLWSVGECMSASAELASRLREAGLDAVAVAGRYHDCEDGYPEIVRRHGPDGLDPDDDLKDWDGTWKHWWVACEGYVVDITADQFHASSPDGYAVVVTDASDPAYRSGPEARAPGGP